MQLLVKDMYQSKFVSDYSVESSCQSSGGGFSFVLPQANGGGVYNLLETLVSRLAQGRENETEGPG